MSEDPMERKQALLEKQAQAREKNKEEKENKEVSELPSEEPAQESSTPLRENMISNAVKFLTHESVQKSPLARKIAFLEGKGLTGDEITEAIRRVDGGGRSTASTNNVQASTNQQAPAPIIQYLPAPPPPPPQRSTFKVVATSIVLTLSAVGGLAWLYNSFLRPSLMKELEKKNQQQRDSSTIIEEVNSPLLQTPKNRIQTREDTKLDESIQQSMSELVKVMKTQQSEVNNTLKMVHTVLTTPDRNNTATKNSLTDQINVKELTNAITALHSLLKNSPTPITPVQRFSPDEEDNTFESTPLRSSKPMEPIKTTSPSTPTRSKPSFADVMKMVQSGQELPNVKQIDDSPINPNTVIEPSSTSKPLKPWMKRRQEKTQQLKSVSASAPSYLQQAKASRDELKTNDSQSNEETKNEEEEVIEEIDADNIPSVVIPGNDEEEEEEKEKVEEIKDE